MLGLVCNGVALFYVSDVDGCWYWYYCFNFVNLYVLYFVFCVGCLLVDLVVIDVVLLL